VRLTATYYEQQGYDAQMYHSPDGDSHVYDVFVSPDNDSPDQRHKIVEVEKRLPRSAATSRETTTSSQWLTETPCG